ncbi:MAG: hypothetical protein CL610_00650 [Anaerolineaceae bacterium]|nr:hypothetical protein [Anaerolineaceae bacterium]
MSETPLNPARGRALTVWLILMALTNAWAIYRYIVILEDFISHSDPQFTVILQWALPLMAIVALINIVGVIFLWRWRRLGFYVLVATTTITLTVNLMLNVPVATSILGLVGLLILWALLRPRWQHFY